MFLSASSSACAACAGGAGGAACMFSSDTDTHVPDVGAGCVVVVVVVVVVDLAEAAGLRGILCDIHNI